MCQLTLLHLHVVWVVSSFDSIVDNNLIPLGNHRDKEYVVHDRSKDLLTNEDVMREYHRELNLEYSEIHNTVLINRSKVKNSNIRDPMVHVDSVVIFQSYLSSIDWIVPIVPREKFSWN